MVQLIMVNQYEMENYLLEQKSEQNFSKLTIKVRIKRYTDNQDGKYPQIESDTNLGLFIFNLLKLTMVIFCKKNPISQYSVLILLKMDFRKHLNKNNKQLICISIIPLTILFISEITDNNFTKIKLKIL